MSQLPIALSHSRLEDVKCLYKFKRKHVDPYADRLKEARTDPLMIGAMFHLVADRYQQALAKNLERQVRSISSHDLLEHIFKEAWAHRPDDLVSLGEEHYEPTRLLLHSWAPQYPVGPTFIASETRIALNQSWERCDWDAKDVRFRMMIDRIDADGSTITVLDWKTSWKADTDEEVKRNPQLIGYALGVQVLAPKAQIINVGLVFPRRHNIQRTVTIDKADFEKAKDRILRESARIERARSQKKWEATPGAQCEYCPAFGECPIKDQAEPFRAPASGQEATNLLNLFHLQSRRMKELAGQLQAYVKMHGKVEAEGLVAEYRSNYSTVYDKDELMEELQAIGVNVDEFLMFNIKALKKVAKGSPEIADALETAAGPGPGKQRWHIGKPGKQEYDEEESE